MERLPKDAERTIREVLHATRVHFGMICKEDNPRLQDAIDGMDISISKLDCLLEEQGPKAKKKGFDPVPPEILRALGFRKMKQAHGGFPKGAWEHRALGIEHGVWRGHMYDPNIHSLRQFAKNFVNALTRQTVMTGSNIMYDTASGVAHRVLKGKTDA